MSEIDLAELSSQFVTKKKVKAPEIHGRSSRKNSCISHQSVHYVYWTKKIYFFDGAFLAAFFLGLFFFAGFAGLVFFGVLGFLAFLGLAAFFGLLAAFLAGDFAFFAFFSPAGFLAAFFAF